MVMLQRHRNKCCLSLTRLLIGVAVSWLAIAQVNADPTAFSAISTEFQRRGLIARGQVVYLHECGTCHGADLKGEAGWQSVGPDGRVKAPPHDETGHTWMHSERELFRLVKFGPGDAVAPGFISPMPVYGACLSDRDIEAVLAFIASRWPPGFRAYQIMLDPGFDPARLPDGDWELPQVCQPLPMSAGR